MMHLFAAVVSVAIGCLFILAYALYVVAGDTDERMGFDDGAYGDD